MDFLQTPTTLHRKIVLSLVAVAFVFYTFLLIKEVGASAGGSDSSGYMNHARLLAEGRFHIPPRQIQGLPPQVLPTYTYVPLGFTADPKSGDLIPTYSVGLPLFVVAARYLVGWSYAGDLVMVLHALAGLFVVYFFAREFGLDELWSLIASVIVATCPVYLFMSLQAMSDVPALVWCTAAVLMAWKSRSKASWAIGAGCAVGIAVLIRPTDPIIMAPVALCLGLCWRRWALLIAGGIPAGLFWMAHNQSLYGNPVLTGYGDIRSGFSWAFAKLTLPAYEAWIPTMFTPLAVLFLLLPLVSSTFRLQAAVLYVWGLSIVLFYLPYYCTNETWWYERFNLPAFPALLVGGLLVVRQIGRRWLAQRSVFVAWAATLVLLASNVGWSYYFDAIDIGRGENTYRHVTDWMKQHLPADAVVGVMQVSGAVYYYTDFTLVRWDQIENGGYPKVLRGTMAAHRPLYAVLYPFELDQGALEHRMPGHWTQIHQLRDVTFWLYTPPGTAKTP